MVPRNPPPPGQYDFFKKRTEDIAHDRHPLVILAKVIDWDSFTKSFGETFHSTTGRPGLPTRLMVGLHYIKHTYNLSDESVLAGFVESPQWQYFCGCEYYQFHPPCDRSSMTYWRKRIGVEKMELLLQETLKAGQRAGIIKKRELKTAVIDTTVQDKGIAYPTDTRLYFKALRSLVRLSKKSGISLRQTYKRKAKECLFKQARFGHGRKFKEARRWERKLKTYLGRVVREIKRKGGGVLKEGGNSKLERCLEISERIWEQKRSDKGKVYSVHAPEVKCYSKGKPHKRYEFGSKVSVAISVKRSWVLGVKSFTESVHDVLTLKSAVAQVQGMTGLLLERVYVDKGYRGKGHHPEGVEVWISGDKGRKSYYEKRLMRRRNCVEGIIGHMKNEGRLGRNFLLGEEGDGVNAVLCGAGQNMRKLMGEVRLCPDFFVIFLQEVYILLKRFRLWFFGQSFFKNLRIQVIFSQ